ncbi:unnamed protein product [Cylindrotheca closterium]|uniref:Uncharacterized protein n=1 Tax=Cylindrotheca closterium TaxID=2856 RepID=A0AAD2PVJ7_9STRA|nr:unnamed protein product [Cylindrotheca closterium]
MLLYSQGNHVTHDHDNSLKCHLVDRFAVTPFHVLLSGANCKLDLFQVLLDAYPPNVFGWKDVNEKTAIEYYWRQSHHPTEDTQTILQVTIHRWMVDSISSWKALEAWNTDMSDKVNAILAQDEEEQRQS